MKSGPLQNLSLAATVLVLLLIVTSPITAVWLIKRHADRIMSDTLQGLASSSLATMHVSEGFLDTAIAVNTGGTQAGELGKRLAESTRIVDAHYDEHRNTLGSEEETRRFNHMIESRTAYRDCRKKVVELLQAGNTAEARSQFEGSCVMKFQAYAQALGDVVQHNAAEARAEGIRIRNLCYALLAIQLVLFLFFFVYGFFVPLTAVWERLTRRSIDFPA